MREEIGGYRLVRVIGRGGMSTVYEAIDGGGNRVALKLLHPAAIAGQAGRARLQRAVTMLQRGGGPDGGAGGGAGPAGGGGVMVPPGGDGPTLSEDVKEDGPYERGDLVELASRLGAAVEAVHAIGVLHRDLKPSNVMIASSGPKLIDFGIAQTGADARLTQSGSVTHTPGYLDPRVLEGAEPDEAADFWALAAVIAFAATGHDPYRGNSTPAIIRRVMDGDVDLSGVPPRVGGALRAALVKPLSRRLPYRDLIAVLRDPASWVDDGSETGAQSGGGPGYAGDMTRAVPRSPQALATLPVDDADFPNLATGSIGQTEPYDAESYDAEQYGAAYAPDAGHTAAYAFGSGRTAAYESAAEASAYERGAGATAAYESAPARPGTNYDDFYGEVEGQVPADALAPIYANQSLNQPRGGGANYPPQSYGPSSYGAEQVRPPNDGGHFADFSPEFEHWGEPSPIPVWARPAPSFPFLTLLAGVIAAVLIWRWPVVGTAVFALLCVCLGVVGITRSALQRRRLSAGRKSASDGFWALGRLPLSLANAILRSAVGVAWGLVGAVALLWVLFGLGLRASEYSLLGAAALFVVLTWYAVLARYVREGSRVVFAVVAPSRGYRFFWGIILLAIVAAAILICSSTPTSWLPLDSPPGFVPDGVPPDWFPTIFQ